MINSVQPNKHKVLNDKSIYIRSKWNSKNIILDTIIKKTSGMSKLRV